MSNTPERESDQRLRELVEMLDAATQNHAPDPELTRALAQELGYPREELESHAQTAWQRGHRLLRSGQIEASRDDLHAAWLLDPANDESTRAYVEVLHHLAFHERGSADDRYRNATLAAQLTEDLHARQPNDRVLDKLWGESRAMSEYFRPAHVEKKFRPGCMGVALAAAAGMIALALKQSAIASGVFFGIIALGLVYLAFAPSTHTLRERKIRPAFMPPPPTPSAAPAQRALASNGKSTPVPKPNAAVAKPNASMAKPNAAVAKPNASVAAPNAPATKATPPAEDLAGPMSIDKSLAATSSPASSAPQASKAKTP